MGFLLLSVDIFVASQCIARYVGKEGSVEAQSSNYVSCIFLYVELLQSCFCVSVKKNVSAKSKMFSPLIFLYHDSKQSIIMIHIPQVKMLKQGFQLFSNNTGFGIQNIFK
jgi:hypothetical protein